MKEFRDYFYSLTEDQRLAFAKGCGTSVGYLNLIASGHRKAGPGLAMKIERESERQVVVETMCPDQPWDVVRGKGSVAVGEVT